VGEHDANLLFDVNEECVLRRGRHLRQYYQPVRTRQAHLVLPGPRGGGRAVSRVTRLTSCAVDLHLQHVYVCGPSVAFAFLEWSILI
jgi:hypothetical protein